MRGRGCEMREKGDNWRGERVMMVIAKRETWNEENEARNVTFCDHRCSLLCLQDGQASCFRLERHGLASSIWVRINDLV